MLKIYESVISYNLSCSFERGEGSTMTALASRLVFIRADRPERVHSGLSRRLAGTDKNFPGLVAYGIFVARDLRWLPGLTKNPTGLVYAPVWPMARAHVMEDFLYGPVKDCATQLGASLAVAESELLVAKSTSNQSLRASATCATLLYWGRNS